MLHVTIVRTSPSATHCPQAMAVTCTLPLATCHHRSHASPSAAWCPRAIPVTRASPSTARHHCSHVTVGCMVRPSNARHPHIAVACTSPFASLSAARCPRATPVTRTSPLPACHCSRHRRLHGAHKQCLSPACRRHRGCAAAVPNLKMLRVQFQNMM